MGEAGSVTIEGAEFQARGQGVKLRLLNLILADSHDNAVQVMGGAEALIQDCEIFGARSCGVEVTDVGSKALVEYSVIHRSEHHGVVVRNGGEATVVQSELNSNSKCGLSVQEVGSTAKVEGCQLATNDDAGVESDYGAELFVTSCVLHGNRSWGVKVDGESTKAKIQSNEIHENEIGIWGWRGAYIDVGGNHVSNNSRIAFEIEDGCHLNTIEVTHSVPTWAGLKPRPSRPQSRYTRPNSALPGLPGTGSHEIKAMALKFATMGYETKANALNELDNDTKAAMLAESTVEARTSMLYQIQKDDRKIVLDKLTRSLSGHQLLQERVNWAQDGGDGQHRPVLATNFVDEDGEYRNYHSRPIHRSVDQEWKQYVSEEEKFLVEGQHVDSKAIQDQITAAKTKEVYLLLGKKVIEDILCGPIAKHQLTPWQSQFEEYGQWDYMNMSFEEQAELAAQKAAEAEAAAAEAAAEEGGAY